MHAPFRIVIYNKFAKSHSQVCMFFLEGLLGAIIHQKAATSGAEVAKHGAKQAQGQPHSGARASFWRPSGVKAAPKWHQSGAKAVFWRASVAKTAPKRHCWAISAPKDFKIQAFQ